MQSSRCAWKALSVFIALALLAASCTAGAGVKCTEQTEVDGKKIILLENEFYQLKIDPGSGGRCISFITKENGTELVYPDESPQGGYPGSVGGFFIDYFAEEPAPGEFLFSPYEYEITGDGEASAGVKLSRVSTGKAKEKGVEKEFPYAAGILLEKEITLKSGDRMIDVGITLTNTADELKNATFWTVQSFRLSADKKDDAYYRPSTRNIQYMGNNPSVTGVIPEEWVRDPADGWTAALDEKTDEGIVFLMDYNDLATLYNGASGTAEWYMDRVVLAPGKSWSTRYGVMSLKGFKGFAYASANLVADIKVQFPEDKIIIEHCLASTGRTLKDVRLKTSILGVRTKKVQALPDVVFEEVGPEPVKKVVELAGAQTEPIVVKVEAVVGELTEKYENYFWGTFAPFILPGYPVPPEYLRPKPKKQKEFISQIDWKFPDDGKIDALLFFGLYTNWYKLEEAIKGLEAHSLKVSNARVGIHYMGADYVPGTYGEMMGYDVIIISDANAGSLKNFGMAMIPPYVRNGGGLFILGGPFSYGQGDYVGTDIEAACPVSGMRDFDLKWEKEGMTLSAAAEHPILEGIDFSQAPKVYWYHDLTVRPDAEVLISARDKPILVASKMGKGKSVAFLGAPLGKPKEGEIPFWEWQQWEKLMQNTIRWLASRD